MKKTKNIKKIYILSVLLLCIAASSLSCTANNTQPKNENPTTESATVEESKETKEVKEVKEVKVSKPNEGGLKQELSTKAAVSTADKNQITFEVPTNQLQGIKVGDALAINSGENAYPATVVTIPQVNPANQNTGSKVIVTAKVGPGVNLPPSNNNYTVTYLYNNRDPRVHYINRDYVYYDGYRPYVYITGPDRVVRRKYIRLGLINRYYSEILDELDDAERIVENYMYDYIENVVIQNIVEDYTTQVIDTYQEYLDSLNDRWDYDDEVNTFTVNVNDIDWEQLEEHDTILTDSDIIEINEEVQTENHRDKDDNDGSGTNEEESSYVNNDDEDEITAASNDRDDEKDETSEQSNDTSELNEEVKNSDDEDENATATTFDNVGNSGDESNDDASNEDYSQNDEQEQNNSQNDVNDNDSNDDSSNYDNYSSNDDDSYSGGGDSSDDEYETTTEAFGDDEN